jgi:hypothetical protein
VLLTPANVCHPQISHREMSKNGCPGPVAETVV